MFEECWNDSLTTNEEVSVPSEFGMPYEDVELKTPDNVLLRCYALVQRKGLETTHQDAMFVDDDYITEDEVRSFATIHYYG